MLGASCGLNAIVAIYADAGYYLEELEYPACGTEYRALRDDDRVLVMSPSRGEVVEALGVELTAQTRGAWQGARACRIFQTFYDHF